MLRLFQAFEGTMFFLALGAHIHAVFFLEGFLLTPPFYLTNPIHPAVPSENMDVSENPPASPTPIGLGLSVETSHRS